MASTIPIFRIFDYDKAVEFYIDWLGFEIDWMYDPPNLPKYFQITLGDIVLHLTEHHGDCTPGARVFIQDFDDLPAYHKKLIDKDYKYSRPGMETPFYNDEVWEMEVGDPFGNRLTFTGPK